MTRAQLPLSLLAVLLVSACGGEERGSPSTGPNPGETYVGSVSCRGCHERFYELWAPSHHGRAMQPYSAELAAELEPQEDEIEIAGRHYRAVFDETGGWVAERGGERETRYPIHHALGGKNVLYFLTPRDRGRLQVLPLAYDVRARTWYDAGASMVRHAADHPAAPVHWTDPLLTFNTACWSCHVSQLSVNYDEASDTYHSVWAEPGINCETCHGPGAEHVRVCSEAPDGQAPADLRIIRVSALTVEQRNDMCAACHAKTMPLTTEFTPGERFFDHFDLVTLEDRDFYPDGRDLGENYTFTLWRMNPCVQGGDLDCLHCHTSSGRYRFPEAQANHACLPCHRERVENVTAHSHHEADSPGSRCVSCHMPMTEFARMRRSDHSMRPPAPALTARFGSPNACNLCHVEEGVAWADQHVRAWRERDYQAPMETAGALVEAARAGEATKLDAIYAYIRSRERDEIVATSLIRLLRGSEDDRKGAALLAALSDPSPLVRGAAAEGLTDAWTPEVVRALLDATGDEFRVVRVRAAGALAGLPGSEVPASHRDRLARALRELEAALGVRPDSWSTHHNLGNLYARRGEPERAIAAYERSTELRGDVVAPLVNAAMMHAELGRLEGAERALRRALEIDAESAAAHYHLGLLLGEKGQRGEAQRHHRRALDIDPGLAGAAHNLAILVAEDDPDEAIALSRRASTLRPNQPRYAWTLAYFLAQQGRGGEAFEVLHDVVGRDRANADVYALLGRLYEQRGERSAARAIYRRASEDARLDPHERQAFAGRARGLEER